jgi:hypothetical protein
MADSWSPGTGRTAIRTASGSTSPIEGSSCRTRRTRSRASGINGLSLVSKFSVASVGFQCSIRRPAPSGRASITVVRTTRLKLAATGGVNTRNPTVGASGKCRPASRVKPLFDTRRGQLACRRLDPRRNVHRFDAGDRGQANTTAPSQKFLCCPVVGPAHVRVADICREEFEEAPAGALAGGGNQRRHPHCRRPQRNGSRSSKRHGQKFVRHRRLPPARLRCDQIATISG